jgi:hypothetical protein
MSTEGKRQTLVVANLTASTPILLQEVKKRAEATPTTFTLLIPNVDAAKSSDWGLPTALELLGRAAGSKVEGRVATGDPFESIQEAVASGTYDDVMISTLPRGRSEWLRKDLPSRVAARNVPVDVITPPEEPGALKSFADQFSAKSPPTAGG